MRVISSGLRMRKIVPLLLGLLALIGTGCIVRGSARVRPVRVVAPSVEVQAPVGVVVYDAPPPPRTTVSVRPAAPIQGAIWVEGHWQWNGASYIWIDGFWEQPRAGYVYVQPRWERRGRGWVYVEGNWRSGGRGRVNVRGRGRGRGRVAPGRGRVDVRPRGNGGGRVRTRPR